MKRKRGLALIPALIIILIGVSMLGISFRDTTTYMRVRDKGIPVEAIIVRISEYTDSDDDTTYTAHAKYSYDGEDYEVRYDSSSRRSKLPSVGKHVNFEINPENPGETMKSLKSSSSFVLFGAPILAFGISGLLARIRSGKLSEVCYPSPDEQTVKNDLKVVVLSRYLRPFWLVNALTLHAFILMFPGLYAVGTHIAAWAFTTFFAICFISAKTAYKDIENCTYIKKTERIYHKSEENDSESGTSYWLHYTDGTNTWKRSVNSDYYNIVAIGATIISLYFPGDAKPCLIYTDNTSSFV